MDLYADASCRQSQRQRELHYVAFRPIVPGDVRGQGNFCLIETAADITWESGGPMGMALDVRWHVIPLTYSNNVC
jgi:hypothetical protein